MIIQDLILRFKQLKKRNPLHANELLDYLQRSYINGELSIVEYKKLFCELDKRNAEKPEEYFFKISPLNLKKINLPS